MRHRKFFIVAIVIALLLTSVPPPTYADIAPPEQSPGSSISPSGKTKVQMLAEKVEFDLQPLHSGSDDYILVTAEFVMLNRGTSDENLQVRFPLDAYNFLEPIPLIQNFKVVVNGIQTTTTIVKEKFAGCPLDDCPLVSWASFNAEFPMQQQVVVRVTYELQPVRISTALGTFNYVLETGAGWYGVIGKATFIMRLPYKATLDNAKGNWIADKAPEYRYNEIRWYAESIEPSGKFNLGFNVVYPDVWRQLLSAQAKVNSVPNNPTAWASLGEAYVETAERFHGSWDLRQLRLSLKAYIQAIKLDPLSAEKYARVAELQWWIELRNDPACVATLPDRKFNLQEILPPLSLALAIDKTNSRAENLLSELESCVGKKITLPKPDSRIMAMLVSPTPTPKP